MTKTLIFKGIKELQFLKMNSYLICMIMADAGLKEFLKIFLNNL